MEAPRDVEKIIIRKLDIDTRRALNIYTRLKVPDQIRAKLDYVIRSKINGLTIVKYKKGCYFIVLHKYMIYCFYDTEDDIYEEYYLHTGTVKAIF